MTDDWDAMATRTRTRKDDGSEVTITETTKWQYSERFWLYEFAGQAMQGLLSNPHATVEMDRDAARMGVLPRTHVVAVAEGYADALLYRLRKREAEDGHQT